MCRRNTPHVPWKGRGRNKPPSRPRISSPLIHGKQTVSSPFPRSHKNGKEKGCIRIQRPLIQPPRVYSTAAKKGYGTNNPKCATATERQQGHRIRHNNKKLALSKRVQYSFLKTVDAAPRCRAQKRPNHPISRTHRPYSRATPPSKTSANARRKRRPQFVNIIKEPTDPHPTVARAHERCRRPRGARPSPLRA